MSTRTTTALSNVRVELFFKEINDLRDRLKLLSGVPAVNFVNKNAKDPLEEWIDVVQDKASNTNHHCCVHYSLRYQKVPRGTRQQHFDKFKAFLQLIPDDIEVLLVSGAVTSSLNNLCTVEALKLLQHASDIDRKVAVAYNPFFPDPTDQQQERQRLQEKVDTGCVSKIYLQFGTDLDLAAATLQDISKFNIPIAASIFLPTKQLIAQQKFRPWKGVFSSNEFLSSPESARGVVTQLICLYHDRNVELLIEAPGVRKETDLALVESLIQDAVNDSATLSAEARARPAIVLFGTHDVRLHDNHAIALAARFHSQILPVFLWEEPTSKWGARGALEVVLKDALRDLSKSLKIHGLPLICRSTADSVQEVGLIAQAVGASVVYHNREMTTEGRVLEERRLRTMKRLKVEVVSCQSSLLYDIEELRLSGGFHGGHWGTLMPFLKSCQKQFGEPPRPESQADAFARLENTSAPQNLPASVTVDELKLAVISASTRWDLPILARFPMTTAAARKHLDAFFDAGLPRYESERSRADIDLATSQLSAHLRIGTLSPYELYWRTVDSSLDMNEKKTFYRRMYWRDLAYYQLYCFPQMPDKSIREHYETMEWAPGEEAQLRLDRWKRGLTGYPLVDAGMRELYATGWMTQSVRMVAASFLVEYLRINWKEGAKWFHYTLVDADVAINSMIWQNAGRSGTDQWNVVLSPENASQDPKGSYTRKWVPELAGLPKQYLHKPGKHPNRSSVSLVSLWARRTPNVLSRISRRNAQRALRMFWQHECGLLTAVTAKVTI